MSASNHDRVREIFHQAVNLSDENRAALLDHECGDDAELRAAVERLLKHHRPDTLLLASEQGDTAPEHNKKPQENVSPTDSDDSHTQRFGQTVAEPAGESAIGLMKRQSQELTGLQKQRRWLLYASSLGLLLLISLGWWLHSAIQDSLGNSLEVSMREMLDHQVRAIENWLETEEELIASWARVPGVVTAINDLNQIAKAEDSPGKSLSASESRSRLRETLNTVTAESGEFSYAVWNREGTLLADSNPNGADLIGNGTTEYGASLLARVFRGKTVLWMPTRAGFITEGFALTENAPKGNMALIAPVYSDNGKKPIAAILMSHSSRQQRFEKMLRDAEFGETGEVYAFADDGFLISESRFNDQLKTIGLIPNTPATYSAQVVRVADPGGNLLKGHQSQFDSAEWPLTRAVTSAIAGINGSDIGGYRDYRGVKVIGVWAWMETYRFGIVAEADHEDAYEPLVPLQRAFAIVFVALIGTALTAIAASLALLRLRQKSNTATTVGPYTLKSLIGEGGFARVYLARHALLRRPTAVKILRPEQINPKNLSRFEREVQLASGLSHPNTINIYDYGATSDGSFYYAMEYIKGPSIQELIDQDGPQCPARVVWILTQICRSLREAHNKGLIHRDIKPQNIMLCRQGGECDFVKVLDFGLARSLEAERNRVTETKLLIGTPLYIAPERIVDPGCMDPRSDIYSLGILGYFLLTGREPFDAQGSMDALAQTINRSARRPSEQTNNPIPKGLDKLIRDCHSRMIIERPQTIEDVLERLGEVTLDEQWTTQKAAEWWDKNQQTTPAQSEPPSTNSQPSETMTLS